MQVAPGVHWIRMPLPFALDHVHCYAVDDADGWTLRSADGSRGATLLAADGKPVKGVKDPARIAAFIEEVRNADD